MEKIETIKDIRAFLDNNRNKILERAVSIEELPVDDELIYEEAISNEKED